MIRFTGFDHPENTSAIVAPVVASTMELEQSGWNHNHDAIPARIQATIVRRLDPFECRASVRWYSMLCYLAGTLAGSEHSVRALGPVEVLMVTTVQTGITGAPVTTIPP